MNLNEWNAPQKSRHHQGLALTSLVEQYVPLALQSPPGIPFCFSMSGYDQAMWTSVTDELGEISLTP